MISAISIPEIITNYPAELCKDHLLMTKQQLNVFIQFPATHRPTGSQQCERTWIFSTYVFWLFEFSIVKILHASTNNFLARLNSQKI